MAPYYYFIDGDDLYIMYEITNNMESLFNPERSGKVLCVYSMDRHNKKVYLYNTEKTDEISGTRINIPDYKELPYTLNGNVTRHENITTSDLSGSWFGGGKSKKSKRPKRNKRTRRHKRSKRTKRYKI